jgi:RimJ/RimL family protein N-acetyltransferase
MIQLLLNRDDYVSAWLMSKIPDINFFDCKAIGVVKNQKLIAGVAYYNLRDGQIEASIAITDKNWCNRKILYALFAYPFVQCRCHRILVTVKDGNKQSIKLAEKLGFKKEGKLRKMFPPNDAVLLGMLRKECKWLKIKENKKWENQDRQPHQYQILPT